MLPTLVAVLLTAAAHPEPAVAPASRDVVTREGIRFQLPPGLSYHVAEEEGVRAHVAVSDDRATAVLVKTFASDAEMPCDEAEESAVPFRTRHGLSACAVGAEGEGQVVALIFVTVGEAFVAITGVAPDAAAIALAGSVADSVEIAPGAARKLPRHDVPKTDPRVLACFERDGNLQGAVQFWRRCFAEDHSFTQEYRFGMSTPVHGWPGSSVVTDRRERSGTWTVSGGVLRLEYEDGEELEVAVELDGDDMVLDGHRWRRR